MDIACLLNHGILSANPISTVYDRPAAIQIDEIISISHYDDECAGAVIMKGNDKESHNTNPSCFYFESTYRFVPDRIACANMTSTRANSKQ